MMVKKLTMGDVLDTSFKIYTRNFCKFMILSGCLYFPVLMLYQIFIQSQMKHFQDEIFTSISNPSEILGVFGSFFASVYGGLAIVSLFFMFFSCAVTWASMKAYRGEPISIGDCMSKGLTYMPAAVGSGIVLFLLGMALFCLCFFPALLVFFFALTLPAIVVEGLGPFAAMGRSSRLTKGAFWRVTGTIVVATFLVGTIQGIVTVPFQGLIMWKSFSGGAVPDLMSLGPLGIAFSVLTGLVGSILAPITLIPSAVLFMGLREEKEAAELEYKLDQLGGSTTPPAGADRA